MDRILSETKPPEPVEAPEPQPADELKKALYPVLDDREREDLATRILHDNNAAIEDRSEWETRLAEWEDQYYGRLAEKTFPWPGCSNFNVPLTMIGVESFKPRLVDGILGMSPPLSLIPSKGADERNKDTVEAFLNWQILTELDIEAKITQSAHLYLQPGLAIAKTTWQVSRTKYRQVREFPKATKLGDIFRAVFGSELPTDLKSTGDLTWEGTMPYHPGVGAPLTATIRLAVLEDSVQVLVEREELVERPQIDLIDPVDFFAPVKGGHEVMDLPWCQLRLWMYEEDLREKVAIGRFDADVVDELIRSHAQPAGDQPQTDSGAYRAGKAAAEGVEDQGPSNVRRYQFEVLEDYRRWEIDGDVHEIIAWFPKDLPGKILGWDFLSNVYAHGRRPIRVGRVHPIPFRFYGLSLAEIVKGLQDEINAIHNQRVDYATVQNLPFYFYRGSATVPPQQQALKPGAGVPIDNPQQDVLFPKWQGNPAWGSQEEATLQQYFERLIGLTDIALGRQPNRVGATRTAKGTQTLLGESGLRFKVILQGFQRFWIGVFSDILALDQEYLPPSKEFRVTGKRPTVLRIKDRTVLAGQYNLRLASTAETMDRQTLRQDASVIVQALMNPALLQSGLVGLKGIRRAISDFLKAYGKDPDFYLEDKPVIRSPGEELMMFLTGHSVSPVMGENIQGHLAAHQASMQDPLVPPEAKQLIRAHIQETMQLQQVQQMAQMMQQGQGAPPMGQQAVNAQQGKQPQAPGGAQPGGGSPAGAGMPMGGSPAGGGPGGGY